MTCDYYESCNLISGWLPKYKGLKSYYMNRYCEGDHTRCARYRLKQVAYEVPDAMLPNASNWADYILSTLITSMDLNSYCSLNRPDQAACQLGEKCDDVCTNLKEVKKQLKRDGLLELARKDGMVLETHDDTLVVRVPGNPQLYPVFRLLPSKSK